MSQAVQTMGVSQEIGRSVRAGGLAVNFHDAGHGAPLVLLHGSGPGVSAWANWRLVIEPFARRRRVIAPDMVGFGYSERPNNLKFDMNMWIEQCIGLLDALELDRADLVGNSFGGALALATAIRHPHRVRRLVLMGAAGVPFTLTPGLDAVWGYEPSIDAMRQLIQLFSFQPVGVTNDLARLRYEASVRPGVHESYAALFPAPRQRWVDALASAESDVRALEHSTLIIHGRDDRIIPMQNSLKLLELIPRSQLHIFGQCGHWTQIEHTQAFIRLIEGFLDAE